MLACARCRGSYAEIFHLTPSVAIRAAGERQKRMPMAVIERVTGRGFKPRFYGARQKAWYLAHRASMAHILTFLVRLNHNQAP
jgi:hypothetical protein